MLTRAVIRNLHVVFKFLYTNDFIGKYPHPIQKKKHVLEALRKARSGTKIGELLFMACLNIAAVTENLLLRKH